jgi:hypothetical protein
MGWQHFCHPLRDPDSSVRADGYALPQSEKFWSADVGQRLNFLNSHIDRPRQQRSESRDAAARPSQARAQGAEGCEPWLDGWVRETGPAKCRNRRKRVKPVSSIGHLEFARKTIPDGPSTAPFCLGTRGSPAVDYAESPRDLPQSTSGLGHVTSRRDAVQQWTTESRLVTRGSPAVDHVASRRASGQSTSGLRQVTSCCDPVHCWTGTVHLVP